MADKITYLSIPAFLVLVLLEVAIYKYKGIKSHSYPEIVVNLSIGLAERLMYLTMYTLFYGIYEYLHDNYALYDIQSNLWTWAVLFILMDILWYWYHRSGHQINLFWAVHIVHHSSNDYNLTVAARITMLQHMVRLAFWGMLPVIGFPTHMIMIVMSFIGAYQVFLHHQLGGKLGFLEYIFVTPSSHRVHHGSNDIYIDKNFGGVLIIWDRMFGTFQKEEEKVVFGLSKPFLIKSFFGSQLHYLLEIFYHAFKSSGWKQALWVLFSNPKYFKSDREFKKIEFQLFGRTKPILELTKPLIYYINIQLLSVAAIISCIGLIDFSSVSTKIHLFILVFSSLIICTSLLTKRKWAYSLELLRLTVLVSFLYMYFGHYSVFIIGILTIGVALLLYNTIQQFYSKLLFSDYDIQNV